MFILQSRFNVRHVPVQKSLTNKATKVSVHAFLPYDSTWETHQPAFVNIIRPDIGGCRLVRFRRVESF